MDIYDLKDLKEALSMIPDGIAENFCFCVSEDGDLCLGCTEGEEEGEMAKNYENYKKKYTEITDVDNLLKNMQKELENEDAGGEPIHNIIKK